MKANYEKGRKKWEQSEGKLWVVKKEMRAKGREAMGREERTGSKGKGSYGYRPSRFPE